MTHHLCHRQHPHLEEREALPHTPRVQLVVGTMKARPALIAVVVVDVDKVVEGQFVVWYTN